VLGEGERRTDVEGDRKRAGKNLGLCCVQGSEMERNKIKIR
jgi:hypothetical protein